MKQNFHYGKFVLTLPFFICAALLFCACGLEEYYVMDRQPTASNIYSYENDDHSLKYFEFYASAKPSTNIPAFLGTAVYYKIYTNASTMVSNHNSIESVNNSTNYSAAAVRLIESYGYRELYTDKGSKSPLVPEGQEGYFVRIRLTNYLEDNGTEESWWSNMARIEIRPSRNGAPVATYEPRRARGSEYTFDFGRYGMSKYANNGLRYDAPTSGDEDFNGGNTTDKKFYIDMYAVAVGRDTTFTSYYSNVEYLGSITIDAGDENN